MPKLAGRKHTRDGEVTGPARESVIVIAVDFGTTFSGLAYAYTADPDEQVTITTWPDAESGGLEGETREKVPSILRYVDGKVEWGFQFQASEQHHRWFKLELDSQHKHKIQGFVAILMELGVPKIDAHIPPEQKVTDYLTALRRHAEEVLRHKVSASPILETPVRYVLTVPAVWSEAAQAKTRACAIAAGMGDEDSIQLISEPEAAAVYALRIMRHAGWKVGDTFILVDAGGGTVDLISYKITQLQPVVILSEATVGTGNMCGSVFVDCLFRKALTKELGGEPGWDDEVLDEATRDFQLLVKPTFTGTSTGQVFKVSVPGLTDNATKGIRRAKYTMSANDVAAIFEPMVHEVIDLILDQIRMLKGNVSRILLVGGFGQSSYLREQIRESIDDIEILQPGNGWSAIARGALMRGIEGVGVDAANIQVHGRVARKHYGTGVNAVFDQSIHDDGRKYWDSAEGMYLIPVMEWFLEKGTTVTNKQSMRLEYYEHQLVSMGRPKEVACDIEYCSDSECDSAPMYRNETVRHLVTLKADLSRVPKAQFPTFLGKDRLKYYKIKYTIKVTFLSAHIQYELIHNNTNYGSVQAEYV